MHPSRSAKLCRDCRHYLPGVWADKDRCNHPAVEVSLTSGLPLASTREARHGVHGPIVRIENDDGSFGKSVRTIVPHADFNCGIEGRYFDPLTAPPQA